MAVPFYKRSDGSWRVNNRILGSGKCQLEINGDDKVSVHIIENGDTVINRVPVTEIVNGSGTAYASIDAMVTATANFFFQVDKKVYTAFLTQTSTNAPVATVLEDEITSMVWARTGAGTYTLTKTGAFVENKTVPVSDIYTDAAGNVYKAVRTSADVITLTTYAAADTETAADGVLSDQYFHVEVYL